MAGEFEPISSHLASTALNHLQQSDIKEYWRKKKTLSTTMMNTIDWEILTKSAKNYKRIKWLSKFVTGICGVGYMLKIWKHQAHSSCPRCGQEDETTQHVLLCRETSSTETWDTALDNLDSWMTDNNSDPEMQEVIINSLKAWRDSSIIFFTEIINQDIRNALDEQEVIGWNNLLNGFISSQWKVIQQ